MNHKFVMIITPITIFLGIAYLINSAYIKSDVDIIGVVVSCTIIIISFILQSMAWYSLKRDELIDRTNELLEEILIKLEEKDQPNNKDIDISINNTKE